MITIYAGLKNNSKFISLTEFEGSVAHEFEEAQGPHCGAGWWVLDGDEVRQPNAEELQARDLAIRSKALKEERDILMDFVTVSYSEKDWTFRPIDMQRLMAKVNLGRDFGWKADDNTIVILTAIQGEEIALLIDDAMTQIFMDAEAAIGAL